MSNVEILSRVGNFLLPDLWEIEQENVKFFKEFPSQAYHSSPKKRKHKLPTKYKIGQKHGKIYIEYKKSDVLMIHKVVIRLAVIKTSQECVGSRKEMLNLNKSRLYIFFFVEISELFSR